MFETCFKAYLKEFTQTSKPVWSYDAGVVLLGAKEMYEATGQTCYYEQLVEYMNHYILDDGSFLDLDETEVNTDKISSGKILCYLYEQTKEEKYKIALDTLMNMLRRYIGTAIDDVYTSLPLYLEYETKYNEKENYNDVYMRMKNARNLFANERLSLSCKMRDLMALIDMYENSSEEVFEQHKQYSIWFKKALKGILTYQYKETQISAIVAYCILKGCRLGILLKEKYQYIGEEIVQELLKQNFGELKDAQDIGTTALAYAEFLKRSEEL